MSRLTQRFQATGDKPTILHNGHRWGPAFFPGKGYEEYSALLDRLAAYEDAQQIAEHSGDTVYAIWEDEVNKCVLVDVCLTHLGTIEMVLCDAEGETLHFSTSSWGRSVFLDKEEAETQIA